MMRNFYTFEINDESLSTTEKSKALETKKSALETEIEKFGINQIKNCSVEGKLKTKTDNGFEKIITGQQKKSVKSKISQVEDYFDFSFKVEAKKEEPKVMPAEIIQTAVEIATTKEAIETRVEVCKPVQQIYDEQANKVVSVARLGSLFD